MSMAGKDLRMKINLSTLSLNFFLFFVQREKWSEDGMEERKNKKKSRENKEKKEGE